MGDCTKKLSESQKYDISTFNSPSLSEDDCNSNFQSQNDTKPCSNESDVEINSKILRIESRLMMVEPLLLMKTELETLKGKIYSFSKFESNVEDIKFQIRQISEELSNQTEKEHNDFITSSSNSDNKNEIKMLKDDIDNLSKRINCIIDGNVGFLSKINDLENNNSEFISKLSVLESKMNTVQDMTIVSLVEKIDSIRTRVESIKKSGEDNYNSLRETIAFLISQNSIVSTNLSKFESTTDDSFSESNRQISVLKQKIDELPFSQQINSLVTSTNSILGLVKELKSQIDKSNSDISNLKNGTESLKNEFSLLKTELTSSQRETKNDLNMKISKLKDQLDKLQNDFISTSGFLTSALEKLSNRDGENNIKEEIEKLKILIRNNSRSIDDVREEINKLNSDNKNIKIDINDSSTKISEIFVKLNSMNTHFENIFSKLSVNDTNTNLEIKNLAEMINRIINDLENNQSKIEIKFNEQNHRIESSLIKNREDIDLEVRNIRKNNDTRFSNLESIIEGQNQKINLSLSNLNEELIDEIHNMKKNNDMRFDRIDETQTQFNKTQSILNGKFRDLSSEFAIILDKLKTHSNSNEWFEDFEIRIKNIECTFDRGRTDFQRIESELNNRLSDFESQRNPSNNDRVNRNDLQRLETDLVKLISDLERKMNGSNSADKSDIQKLQSEFIKLITDLEKKIGSNGSLAENVSNFENNFMEHISNIESRNTESRNIDSRWNGDTENQKDQYLKLVRKWNDGIGSRIKQLESISISESALFSPTDRNLIYKLLADFRTKIGSLHNASPGLVEMWELELKSKIEELENKINSCNSCNSFTKRSEERDSSVKMTYTANALIGNIISIPFNGKLNRVRVMLDGVFEVPLSKSDGYLYSYRGDMVHILCGNNSIGHTFTPNGRVTDRNSGTYSISLY